MAKLTLNARAGFNAGENVYSKMLRITDIEIDPEISKVFVQDDKVRAEIKAKMEKIGFDKSQPLVIWKGKNILLDGHTRLAAAREANLTDVPVTEMEFETLDDAILYTFERQAMRRNLTSADILTAAQMLKPKLKKDGTGRAAEQLARRLGVNASTIYIANKIMQEADVEDIKAIQRGEKTITGVYKTIKGKSDHIPKTLVKKIDKELENGESFGITIEHLIAETKLPSAVRVLKPVVELISETEKEFSRLTIINLLINHFLRKKERASFIKLLKPTVRTVLEEKPETVTQNS